MSPPTDGVVGPVVALVAACNEAGTVADTVEGLRRLPDVDRVIVIDDGSRDDTANEARRAGAAVLRISRTEGKGAAVAAGIAAAPDAAVYLLVDADTGRTSAAAAALLAPVFDGQADLAIGVLPLGVTGGRGWVRRLAGAGIGRACGFRARAPLSGQRAVRGPLLRGLALADRFGLETGLTIDAIRAGARVVEVDVDMRHRPTGPGWRGYVHRAGQGLDVARALWSRLTTARVRIALIAGSTALVAILALWSGAASQPASVPASGPASKVVVFGMPHLSWSDVGTGRLSALDRLIARGAIAALNVRTVSGVPSTAEGYATLGAGARTQVSPAAASTAGAASRAATQGDAAPAGGPQGGASPAGGRQAGATPASGAHGAIEPLVVPGVTALDRVHRAAYRPSHVGALGQALMSAGRSAAFVGDADTGEALPRSPAADRPAALALMDRGGLVAGDVSADLMVADPAMAFGVRADPTRVSAAMADALSRADVVLVDPGDLDRAAALALVATPAAAAVARERALTATDAVLAQVASRLPASALLLVVPVAPPGTVWHTEPVVAAGAGVVPGGLLSPATGRAGLVTLADVAPTILVAIGVRPPAEMSGAPFRYQPGRPQIGRLAQLDRAAVWRERLYFRTAVAFIVVQSVLYAGAAVLHCRLGGARRLGPWLRWAMVGVVAFAPATYLLRAMPRASSLGLAAVPVLLAIDVALAALALRLGRRPLSPLAWLMGGLLVLLALDLATGATLQPASILGYSLHTASRYRGIGNTAFAALAVATVLLGAVHLGHAPRPSEARVAVACLFAFSTLMVGAPSLGDKVGGTLALAAVLIVAWPALAGRRLTLRRVVAGGVVAAAAAVLVAIADLARPAGSRTHLGRFAGDVVSGRLGQVGTTLARRASANLHSYRTGWNVAVVALAAGLLLMLLDRRRWTVLLPPGGVARTAAIAALAVGLLGNVVEDSGAIVTAMVFVFLCPWLVLLALEREQPGPSLLEPTAAPVEVAAG